MTDFTDGGARMHTDVQRCSDRITVTLTGELDRLSGPRVADLLDSVMDGGAGRVDVDMSQLSFADLCGVRVLLHAHRLGARRGVALTLRRPQPHIVWLLRITGVADHLLDDSATESPGPGERRADERDRRADERDRRADERDRRADERDRRADEREEQADDRERLARERDHYLDERQQRVEEHQRWEDIREDLANTRERRLQHREQQP